MIINPDRFEWFCMFDPSNSAFGVAVYFFDPRHKRLFLIEELYEKDQASTASAIWKAIVPKIIRYQPSISEWKFYYDPAAAWFGQETLALKHKGDIHSEIALMKAPKRAGTKEDGISVILTLFDENRFSIASHCKHAIWEFETYSRKPNGEIPKKGDNIIDNTRYLVTILQRRIFSSVVGNSPEQNAFRPTAKTTVRELRQGKERSSKNLVGVILGKYN